MGGYKYLLLEMDETTAIVSINRPEALNALNEEVLSELKQMVINLGQNDNVKVIILTGASPKSFVAGADIAAMLGKNVQEAQEFAMMGQQILHLIEDLGKPVIAAVNGFALGGGCELAMACDIRIASEKARFGLPEVGLGIIPGFGGTQRLARLVGSGMAKYLTFSGGMISAEEALRIGLVEKVVTADNLIKTAKELATEIAQKSPAAVRLAKQAINQGMDMDMHNGNLLESVLTGLCYALPDSREGMTAFLEKRKPQFHSRL